MIGKRVYFDQDPEVELQLRAGEYGAHPHSRGLWLIRPPEFMTVGLWEKSLTGRADHHEIQEHADGTITVAGPFSVEWVEVKRVKGRPVIVVQKSWTGTLKAGVWAVS